jgi:hypothetical protein
MSRSVVLTIPVLTPSLNVMLGQHWAARSKHNDSYIWHLKVALGKEEGWETKVGEVREIEIVSFRTRVVDHDNFIGGTKGLIDAMKKVGLIWQDDKKHLIWRGLVQIKVPHRNECRTEIAIFIGEKKHDKSKS